jgi:hypothetical protein
VATIFVRRTIGEARYTAATVDNVQHLDRDRSRAGGPAPRRIHEEPSVPNTPDPRDDTRLHAGLVITVEPIVAAGGSGIRAGGDGRPLVLTA